VKNHREVIEILEFSCPYGHMTRGENALKGVFEQKQCRDRQSAQELTNLSQERVRVIPVIVSSLGAVYMQSLKYLDTILRYNHR
jgi:hypothetical protein